MRTKKYKNSRGRLSVILAFLLLSIQVRAVELTADSVVNDTTGVNLSEIVVKGASHRILSEGVSYAPSKDSKRLSVDATNLLENMGIPQLKVINGNVSTVEGNSVTIFIDYIKASEAELKDMRPKDVLRVEVLDYPQDVRFGNCEHVVNFIMRKYDWGGYTSFRLNGQLFNQEYVSGSIYQKFSYKKWMFDLSVGGQGLWSTRKEDYIQENIKDFVYEGSSYPEIVRTSQTVMYKFNFDSEEAAFRATYRNEKMTVSHQLSFRRQSVPTETEESYIDFSPQLIPGSKATTNNTFLLNNVTLNGDYYFSMPQNNSIGINWFFEFQKHKFYSDYTLGDMAAIINSSYTTKYRPYISINYSKKTRS